MLCKGPLQERLTVKIPYWYFLLGPALLIALGFSMNAVVMAVNNGQMPVLVPGGCTPLIQDALDSEQANEGLAVHACMTNASRLRILADWIVIRHLGVASLGDFCQWAGELTMTFGFVIWAFAMITRRTA